MSAIADIFASVRLNLDTGTFQADAVKVADSAGASMGATLAGQIKTKMSGTVIAGIGLELGKQLVRGFETAVSDIASIVPNMISQGQAFAANVEEMTKKTGASAESASRFAGTLTYLGQSTEGLGMMLKTLSVQVVSNEDQFTKLGIATRDSSGNLLDIITILNNLRGYLSTAGDGATKMALATHLLGRSAGNLIEFLNLTNAQADLLNSTLDNLGVTINSETAAAAEGMARETNLLGLAWQGFSNILFTNVAPAIREVIGWATQFIATNGAQIRKTIEDITQSIFGFITGLVGGAGITPFQTQLDALGGSASNVTLSFDQWAQQMGYTIPRIAATGNATKDATAQITKQEKALATLEKQQDRTYKSALDSLNAQLDAQGKLFDAQDQKIARAQRDLDLQRALRDSQEALDRAQLDATEAIAAANADPKVSADARARIAIDSARSVRDAEESLAQARQAMSDETRTRSEQDRKAQIDGVKAYLTEVDKLVSDADNRQANLADLKGREKTLTAGGPVVPGSDRAIELQGVLAAEKRIRQAMANATKQDELAALKSSLAAQDSATVSSDKATLAKLKAQYAAYLETQKTETATHVGILSRMYESDPKTGKGGLGGAISKAFLDGQKFGEDFKKFLEGPLKTAVQTVIDMFTTLANLLANDAAVLKWISNPDLTLRGILGPHLGDLFGATEANPNGVLSNTKPLFGNPGSSHGYNGGDPNLAPFKAGGGPVSSGMPYLVGERGPELFVPATNGSIAPSGSFGGQPAIIRLEIGGRPLLDYVDQNLAYRGVRRT